MSKKFGSSIEFSTFESEPRHKMIPVNQSICIYDDLLHSLRLMAVLPQTLLQVINDVTLVVAQNTVDYEALDLYTVNVSLSIVVYQSVILSRFKSLSVVIASNRYLIWEVKDSNLS